MVNSILTQPDFEVSEAHRQAMAKALKQFPSDGLLLEGIGTWRMEDKDYQGAVDIFEQIIAQNLPQATYRTRNNLAMAYSQIPGKAIMGLKHIDQAIRVRKDPELLDTRGVVLLKAGRIEEAEQTFRRLVNQFNQPHHRFHLILSLEAMNRIEDARQEWQKMELNKLVAGALTDNERSELLRMQAKYKTNTNESSHP